MTGEAGMVGQLAGEDSSRLEVATRMASSPPQRVIADRGSRARFAAAMAPC